MADALDLARVSARVTVWHMTCALRICCPALHAVLQVLSSALMTACCSVWLDPQLHPTDPVFSKLPFFISMQVLVGPLRQRLRAELSNPVATTGH